MTHLTFVVSRVANGYTVQEIVEGSPVTEDAAACYIAPTQKEVGEVVKTICRGAFKDEDAKASPKGQEKKGE